MTMLSVYTTVIVCLLLSSTVVQATEVDSENIKQAEELLLEPDVQESEDPEKVSVRSPILQWIISTETIRLSIGSGRTRLKNPVGFDLPSITYETGEPEEKLFDFGRLVASYSREKPIAWERRVKQLWTARIDSEDYNGLKLTNVMIGPGISVSPALARGGLGFRLAAGLGTGFTRSETFFDETYHLAFEGWVEYGIQLGRFVIDATIRERETIDRNLDGRNASPRTRLKMLTLGFLF